ncbi:MAG: hypothetical protein DRG78_15425 [Epsilonproteobacteria bacterium]|nr:MAG: hypothetical protein DRG78_15425 [Campylobacterota bacterium]
MNTISATNKTTILKKLLKFFLPILIIPIIVVVFFYHYYINTLITKGIINQSKNTIERISKSQDIQKHLKVSQDISLPNISIIDSEAKVILTNILYDQHIDIIKKYIIDVTNTKDVKLYHNKANKFMIKPIVENNKVTAFIIINYKNNIDKRLATTSQTLTFILVIVILTFFISIIFTLLFAVQITTPIKELINGIEIISKGDKTHKIEVSTNDEINILVNSFNDMINKINNHQKDIEVLNNNLTHRVKKEVEENRKKDQQLIQQSRLAQMGEMISMIAHQWRQPLAAISSTSTSISLKAQLNKLDNDLAIRLSNKISDYSLHLSSTIDDFREFFRTNKEKRDITYNELIQSVLSIVETSILNKNININKNINCNDTLSTYPNEVKQVILNIIKNAEDILLEKNIQNPTITIETKCGELVIRDNAGGIPNDIIDKVFDPYFSTKTEKDGTGLGLYMSKTIIEKHCGGELTVANNDEGAVFTIKLRDNDD